MSSRIFLILTFSTYYVRFRGINARVSETHLLQTFHNYHPLLFDTLWPWVERVQIHWYNISGCCFRFSLVRKKRGRVAGKHNYCEKPPPKAPDLKISANIWQKRSYRHPLQVTLPCHGPLQLAASFWRISVTPLRSFILQFRLPLHSLLPAWKTEMTASSIFERVKDSNTCCKVEPEVVPSMTVNNHNYSYRLRFSCFIFPTGLSNATTSMAE